MDDRRAGVVRRTVLITGATSGIGLALAMRLAAGADLLLTGRRTPSEADGVIPPGSRYLATDQIDPEGAADAILAAIGAAGWERLDLAVLNAGTGRAVDPAAEAASNIRATLDANLVAPIALSQRLLPLLEAAGGALVLVGSVARRGAPGFASYAASKAGLDGFGRALAEEWRGRVTVKVVHPGPTATAMHARAGFDPGRAGRLFMDPASVAMQIERACKKARTRSNASYLGLAMARLTGRR